ncbi:MAG: thioredoxin family protein [Balneolaceae bacterium]|nr:thioredoxin family protein [Balneolaceae bacterium]
MAAVESMMVELGTKAPSFKLPSVTGGNVELYRYAKNSKGTVILFICNHCPYVMHINAKLVEIANKYIQRGIAFIAISSNDVEKYPADSPEEMKKLSKNEGFQFPYLYDESQEVAKAYEAACTPDLYVFDGDLKLTYRGQFDDSRPGNGKEVTGSDLQQAIEAILNNNAPIEPQVPSIGCNIKWKPGNEPSYFG